MIIVAKKNTAPAEMYASTEAKISNFPISEWVHNPASLSKLKSEGKELAVNETDVYAYVPDLMVLLGLSRQNKISEIDSTTHGLIISGFKHKDNLLSSSENSQLKWTAILNMDNLGLVTYPITVSLKDDSALYKVVDQAELRTIYATMVGTGKIHHDSGEVLKTQVRNATTLKDIDEISDNRVIT